MRIENKNIICLFTDGSSILNRGKLEISIYKDYFYYGNYNTELFKFFICSYQYRFAECGSDGYIKYFYKSFNYNPYPDTWF